MTHLPNNGTQVIKTLPVCRTVQHFARRCLKLFWTPDQRRIQKVAKFILESHTFHTKSKAIKILTCKNFATLLDPPLQTLTPDCQAYQHGRQTINEAKNECFSVHKIFVNALLCLHFYFLGHTSLLCSENYHTTHLRSIRNCLLLCLFNLL